MSPLPQLAKQIKAIEKAKDQKDVLRLVDGNLLVKWLHTQMGKTQIAELLDQHVPTYQELARVMPHFGPDKHRHVWSRVQAPSEEFFFSF